MIGMDGWMADGGVSALPPAVHCVGGFRAAVVWRWQMNTSGRRKKNTSNEKKNPNLLEMLLYLSGKDKKKKISFLLALCLEQSARRFQGLCSLNGLAHRLHF